MTSESAHLPSQEPVSTSPEEEGGLAGREVRDINADADEAPEEATAPSRSLAPLRMIYREAGKYPREIGFALLLAFGAAAAPLVYFGMVGALLLSYTLARLLPTGLWTSWLVWLGFPQAAALFLGFITAGLHFLRNVESKSGSETKT